MAGFKRGGARGGFKKASSYTKKRSSPSNDASDSAPRATKKARNDDADEDEASTTPVVPELQTDDEGNPYISVHILSHYTDVMEKKGEKLTRG
jgi:hypothetical protein